MRDNFDNTDNNDTQRQPEFPQGMQFGGFMGFPYFLQNLIPGQQQFQPPFGPPFGPPSGQPPFGPPFGPPSGQPPFGPPFGPPSGQPPFGPPFGPPSGGAAGGPPSGPPPSFVPSKASAQQTVGVYAIDPGAIRRCLYRYVYIWLENGRSFWAWLVFVGRTSVAGWRWNGYRWVYFGVDLSSIEAFVCY